VKITLFEGDCYVSYEELNVQSNYHNQERGLSFTGDTLLVENVGVKNEIFLILTIISS